MGFFQRIFKNKSIVTIIAGIVCLAILFFAYRYRVAKAIDTISIPVASRPLKGRETITEKDIDTVKVASALITSNVIRSKTNIIDKKVNYNTKIPEGGLFYSSAVVEEKAMPDSAWSSIAKDTTIFSLPVNSTTTYGNSIYPGDVIDLYYKGTDNQGKLIYGRFIEGITVLAVKDANGNHIFKKSAEQTNAAALIFEVKDTVEDNMFLLLKCATYIQGASIIPVPRNSKYKDITNKSETNISSEYLKNEVIAKQCMLLVPDEIESSGIDIDITE